MTSIFDNIKRRVTSIEAGLDRLLRNKFYNRSQYPSIVSTIEKTLENTHIWLEYRKILVAQSTCFYQLIFTYFEELESLINQLWVILKPKNGKKIIRRNFRIRQQKKTADSIVSTFKRISETLDDLNYNDSEIREALEKGLEISFDKDIMSPLRRKIKFHVTERGEKTYMFPWSDPEDYPSYIQNKSRFRAEVVDRRLPTGENASGHKECCKGLKKYVLCGKRGNPRKTIVGGKKEIFEIRMVKCKECGQRFSLLPSFLPREKNYGIDTIGIVCRGLFLRLNSIQAALEHTEHLGKNRVKSRQTIIDWMRWMGSLHPAEILTGAGIKGTGYLQEDEGFEKEPNLRTYSVIMCDPKTQLVWHSDYVDHVDETTLTYSFEKFLKNISFKIFGVAKDKWLSSTKALKNVFNGVWIGYCHRHCLKNFQRALDKYQAESKCSGKEKSNLYKKYKKVLKTSTSKVNLMAKIKSLNDQAFRNPLLSERVAELKENATHYTAHQNRNGITQTTSIVDNFLKHVKRKLREVESFRDKEWTKLFFKGIANARNFIPFVSGSKNAKKSPFVLAGGQTYDLPWAQVMNIHNAFLFSKGE
ncbi:MAG: hypothetical protein GY834_01760 [Bacteroidetes bacterium]|nr:hypothetical protein [Bacteroidota bacterium]